jgi:hypothetical protein
MGNEIFVPTLVLGRSKQNFFYIIIPFSRALPRIKRISERRGWGVEGVGRGGGEFST